MRHGATAPATSGRREPDAVEQEAVKIGEQEAELVEQVAAAEQVLAAATSRREEAELAEAAEARSYAAQLRAVADRLTETEIYAVAEYLAGL